MNMHDDPSWYRRYANLLEDYQALVCYTNECFAQDAQTIQALRQEIKDLHERLEYTIESIIDGL